MISKPEEIRTVSGPVERREKHSFLISIIGGMAHVLSPLLRFRSDFLHLFFIREGKELLGHKHKSFWVLLAIMCITFIAIGFSNGSLKYLEEKMSDPFINWVNLELPMRSSEIVYELRNTLDDETNKQEYRYASLEGYYKYDLYFHDHVREGRYRAMGRTIDHENPLLDVIFSSKNLVHGRRFDSETDLGFIVTEAFLDQFNYSKNNTHVLMYYSTENTNRIIDVPIPIIAVVKELPDMVAFASTPYFYNQRYLDTRGLNPFNPVHTAELVMYFPNTGSKFQEAAQNVQEFLREHDMVKDRSPSFVTDQTLDAFKEGMELRVSFFPSIGEIGGLVQLYEEIVEKFQLDRTQVLQLFDVRTTRAYAYRDFDFFSINFHSLDRIRAFKDFLYQENNIEIEMSQIESKENFNFVSKLTRFISIILLGFCILSISMFLSNLLHNHLFKIRMNIGTFKAFGLGSVLLKRIYLSIIGIFIAIAMIISIGIASAFGYSGGVRLFLNLLQIELETGQNYFTLMDIWTVLGIISIICVSLLSIYYNNNSILNEMPGNLINNRTKNNLNPKTKKNGGIMKTKTTLFTMIAVVFLSLSSFSQQKVTIEQIIESPNRFDNVYIKTDGLVVSYIPMTSGTTAYYTLRGDMGGMIRVNTATSAPVTNEKVCISGTVYIGADNRPFISEKARYQGVCYDVPFITLSSTDIKFRETRPNQSTQAKLIVGNSGRETLILTDFLMSHRDAFDLIIPSHTTIPPGASAEVIIIFTPKDAGEYTGYLTIHHNADNRIESIRFTGISEDIIIWKAYLPYAIALAVLLLIILIIVLVSRTSKTKAIAYTPPPVHEEPTKMKTRNELETIVIPRSDPKTVKNFPGEFEIVTGMDKGKKFKMPGNQVNGELIITVGRKIPTDDKAQFHIQLKENTVGREQAEIINRDGKTYLKNLGTTNYSVVDGKSIQPLEVVEVNNESIIQFGEVGIAYRY